MAVNPDTLSSLYNHGIIDSIDPMLMAGQPVVQNQAMSNPYANYMNSAMQGALYQNHGMQADSFTFSGGNIYDSSNIGSKSNSFTNMFGASSVGYKNQSDILGTGDPTIGSKYQGGFESAHGGFTDVRNNINGGMAKASSVYNGTPSWIKGLLAVGIAVVGVKMLFRGNGKKAAEKVGLWGKIKQKFSKKTAQQTAQTVQPVQPEETAKKSSLLSKLKFWKKSK